MKPPVDRLARFLASPPVLSLIALFGLALAVYSAIEGFVVPMLLGLGATALILSLVALEKTK